MTHDAVHGPAGRQVVVVTGASSGIGRATARAFARQGACVVLASRSPRSLAAVERECIADGGTVLVVPTDVLDRDAVTALVDKATERFGPIDVFVNSAAVVGYGTFEDVPAEVFDRIVSTGILGTANVARAVLPHMKERRSGTLVLMGSVLGHIPTPYLSPYITAKWGIRGLARVLQVEARGTGVNVCMVSPGGVNTPIYRTAANYVGRPGRPPFPVDEPESVADAVVRVTEHPRREVQVGLANRLMMFGNAATPALFDLLVGPLMRTLGLRRGKIAPTVGNAFEPTPEMDSPRSLWSRQGLRLKQLPPRQLRPHDAEASQGRSE